MLDLALRPKDSSLIATRTSRRSRKVFLWLGVGPLVVTILTLGIALRGNYRQDRLSYTFESLESVDRLHKSVFGVQVAARTFLFTRQDTALKEYSDARKRMEERMKVVGRFAADNPPQLDALHQLRAALDRRDLVYERSFAQRPKAVSRLGIDSVSWPDLENAAELERILDPIRTRESGLLEERANRARQNQYFLLVLYGVGLVVNGWVAYIGYHLALRYRSERDDTESGIRRLNAELETRVAERTLALERNLVLLKRSNAELERFAYIASHDLQEPVRQIGSFVSLIAKRYSPLLDEDGRRYIDFAVGGASRIQELINALLVYSSLGSSPLQLSECSLAELWIRCVRRADAERNLKGVYQDLPTLIGDERRLEMVFDALIANAIKFRQVDRPLELSIGAIAEAGGGWLVTVTDNGMGFDPQYISQAFSVFGRLNSLSRYPGAGMGLAMVKRIVEDHGGNVTIETAVGRGTAVSFTIPGSPPDVPIQ